VHASQRHRAFNRIFCIGLNKTGTRSLHEAFKRLGLRSIHHGPEPYASIDEHLLKAQALSASIDRKRREGRPLLEDVDGYDAYSDIGALLKHFELLDRQYPGSKFIYSHRDEDDWIESRRRHAERNLQAVRAGRRCVEGLVESDPERWRRGRARYERRVFDYFRGRPGDLLVIDVCAGEGYAKLCPFLGFDVLDEPFPNRS